MQSFDIASLIGPSKREARPQPQPATSSAPVAAATAAAADHNSRLQLEQLLMTAAAASSSGNAPTGIPPHIQLLTDGLHSHLAAVPPSPPLDGSNSSSSNSPSSPHHAGGPRSPPSSSAHHHSSSHRAHPYMSDDGGIRRYRTAFSREQIGRLEKEFTKENYVSRKTRSELAHELNLPEGTIKVWFQNRRMKDKRQKISGLPWQLLAPPHLAAYMLAAASSAAAGPLPGNLSGSCDLWNKAAAAAGFAYAANPALAFPTTLHTSSISTSSHHSSGSPQAQPAPSSDVALTNSSDDAAAAVAPLAAIKTEPAPSGANSSQSSPHTPLQ